MISDILWHLRVRLGFEQNEGYGGVSPLSPLFFSPLLPPLVCVEGPGRLIFGTPFEQSMLSFCHWELDCPLGTSDSHLSPTCSVLRGSAERATFPGTTQSCSVQVGGFACWASLPSCTDGLTSFWSDNWIHTRVANCPSLPRTYCTAF